MTPALELFVLSWGVYPRRITLYLAEKGLAGSPHIKVTEITPSPEGKMIAEGKPPGTVPVLKLPDGSFIKQSVAILHYLEDICNSPDPDQAWQVELSQTATRGDMLGATAQERARTKDMLCLADEACSQFTLACHKGSRLFEGMEQTNALASKLIMEFCMKNLTQLETYYAEQASIGQQRDPTLCDCVLYSTLAFAENVYGRDLCSEAELPHLRSFYQDFGIRQSARIPNGFYPDMIVQLASQWIPVE